jgi:hypothetical protein
MRKQAAPQASGFLPAVKALTRSYFVTDKKRTYSLIYPAGVQDGVMQGFE